MSTPPPSVTDTSLRSWKESYGAGLLRFFGRRAHPNDVEDLAQEVFRRLDRGIRSGAIDNPQRYTFTVAHRVLLNYRRDRGDRQFEELDDVGEEQFADVMSPERIAIGRQEYQRAIAAITALPPRARAAFQFHRFEDMTYDAISKRMGISRNSVKQLIARAVVTLAKAMRDVE